MSFAAAMTTATTRPEASMLAGMTNSTTFSDLPGETPIYQYQSISHTEATVSSLNTGKTEYCVFLNVSENAMCRDSEETKVGRITFFPNSNFITIIKVPSRQHDAASIWLAIHINEKLKES